MIVWLALWIGLVSGFLDAVVQQIEAYWIHFPIASSPHHLWMAPIANLFFFLPAGLIARRFPRGPAIFSLVLFGCLSAGYQPVRAFAVSLQDGSALWPSLAWLFLGVGLSVQVTRGLLRFNERLESVARLGFVTTAASLLLLTVTLCARDAHQDLAKGPKRDSEGPKWGSSNTNIVLITLDSVRAQDLSLYGYTHRNTPELERLAKRGVTFQHAYANAPWTLPSHASIFTARPPIQLTADYFSPLYGTYPTLAEVLSNSGYLTAGFAANRFYCNASYGLNHGFGHYDDVPISADDLLVSNFLGRWTASHFSWPPLYYDVGRRSATQINDAFLRWEQRQASRPFFAFLNYYDAHYPYWPPDALNGQIGHVHNRIVSLQSTLSANQLTPEDTQFEHDVYDEAISYLDTKVDDLVYRMQGLGLMDNTVLVITSDHGEDFGEHGFMKHGDTLYTQALWVPLLIIYPKKVPAGKVVTQSVGLTDVADTVLSLAGNPSRLPGSSLERCWNGAQAAGYSQSSQIPELDIPSVANGGASDRGAPAGKSPTWGGDMVVSYLTQAGRNSAVSCICGPLHYIQDAVAGEELYDLRSDPEEMHDLSLYQKNRPQVEWFRRYVVEHVPTGWKKVPPPGTHRAGDSAMLDD